MNRLYQDFERTRTRYSRAQESRYKFLNESNWNWVNYYRSVVEEWYSNFPKELDFYKQFTSKKDKQHLSAFFELYMFAIFSNCGFKVNYHRSIGRRKMDLTLVNDREILVDCTLSGEPNLSISIKNIEQQIEDSIEEIQNYGYLISLYFIKTNVKTPKISSIKTAVKKELASLNLDTGESKKLIWEDKGWSLEFTFTKTEFLLDRALSSISTSQGGGFTDGESMKILRKTLDNKRGSSYQVNQPYLIAVNSYNFSLNREIIKGALYGNMKIKGFQNNLSLDNPFFYTDKPQNTSVAGIVLVRGLFSSNMDQVKIELWMNPWAKHSIANEFHEFESFIPILDVNNLIAAFEVKEGRKPFEILNIKENYLNYGH